LQAFFMPRTTRCLHQSGVGIKKESSAKRGWFCAGLFGIRIKKDLLNEVRKIKRAFKWYGLSN